MKLYISVLNCVSCVAVVLLHTNGIFGVILRENFGFRRILLKLIFTGRCRYFL